MVVCHYFLQGRCHFGPNCRNEHIFNKSSDTRGGRHSGNSPLDNLLWQIKNHIIACEKGGQWPLSCYAPIEKGQCLPYWEDVSPEEVRWTMYEARKTGTINQAMNQIMQWHKKAESARNLLKQPTPAAIQAVDDVLKGKKVEQPSATTTNDSFGSSSVTDAKTTFRFDTTINKLLGKSAPQTSPGASLQTTKSGSIFGNTGNTSSGFQSQNIFGQSLTPNNTSNIFPRPEQSRQNIFSDSGNTGRNIFSGQPLSQGFPSPNVDGQKIFPNQSQTNAFASNSPVFGASDKVANNSKTGKSIFGGSAENYPFKFQILNPPQQTESNPIKTDSATSSNIFAKDFDFSSYSKTEDLNKNELKSYNSTTFTFGKIPLKPPPQEFC